MLVNFEDINPDARIWIYQSERQLSSDDKEFLNKELHQFVDGWEAHGKPVRASYAILRDHFIVFAADESFNAVTGCSIDSSVAVIKRVSEKLQTDFFDRTNIAYLDGDRVKFVKLPGIQTAITEGLISSDTVVFNNLVKDVSEFNSAWKKPAATTWLSRFFSQEAV